MSQEKRFLEDVGLRDFPFPITVPSRGDPNGQHTVASISISARIMHEFEAQWIDRFARVLHSHRSHISCAALNRNIDDYVRELGATMVRIDFTYPFFVEKLTPASKERCLVKYQCTYSAKVPNVNKGPRVMFNVDVPVITSYPASHPDLPNGLFGQLSVVSVNVISTDDTYPEDIIDIVDRHSLFPVYSFLTADDQLYAIKRVHAERKDSVVMTDEIREELSHHREIEYYSVSCANRGMLHSYATVVSTEKSMWVPFSGYGEEEV